MNFQFKKFLKYFFIGIFSLSFLLAQKVGAATPTISNVSGTIANGQTLTISGNNMMQAIAGNFSVSAGSFEGTNYSTDGWTQVGSGAVYDSDIKLHGNQSFRSDIAGTYDGSSGCNAEYNSFGPSLYRSMGAYGRIYVRYSSNMGTFWAEAGDPTHGARLKMLETVSPGNQYINPTISADGPHSMWVQTTSLSEENLSFNDAPWVPLRWYCVEWYFNPSYTQVWVDGQSIGTLAGNNFTDYFFPEIGTINGCPVNGTYSMYIDGVMSGSSRVYPASTIEISGDNGSTWKYQPPNMISDTSIQITADLPILTAAGYLLRVTSNTQETSSTYNLSGSSDTIPPASPQGLAVL